MKSILKHFWLLKIGQLKNLLQILKLYSKPFKQSRNPVLIASIDDFNHGRYAFQVLNYLTLSGYDILIFNSTRFLIKLHDYDRMIFNLPGLQVVSKRRVLKLHIATVLIVNKKKKELPIKKEWKVLNAEFNYFKPDVRDECTIEVPYYMHPIISKFKELGVYKKANRRSGVFFYGQAVLLDNTYLVNKYFKLESRSTVFKFLNNAEIKKEEPQTYEELIFMVNSLSNKLYLVDGEKFRIPADEWLSTLSAFDFFIATPGMIMPHCHNLIEAMSMGVIPILQFPHELQPCLEDDINCLKFSSIEELPYVIEKALAMESMRVKQMSGNVIKYYMKNIDPSSFKNKIDNSNCQEVKLLINAEEVSLNNIQNV